MVRFPSEVITRIIEFIAPNPNPYNCLDTITSLQEICEENNLDQGGSKLDLIRRLLLNGFYARRPFWDSKAMGEYWGLQSACPIPLLTFQKRLHTESTWNTETKIICDEAIEWQDKYYSGKPIDKDGIKLLLSKHWTSIALAVAYHDRFLHTMKKICTDCGCFSKPNDLVPKGYNGYTTFRVYSELLECRRICHLSSCYPWPPHPTHPMKEN